MDLYTIWGSPAGDEFTLCPGPGPHPHDTPGLVKLKEFRAASWDEARAAYRRMVEDLPVLPAAGG